MASCNVQHFTRLQEAIVLSKIILMYAFLVRGHAVAQLVEALRYKSEGRGLDSRWCYWNFPLT